METRKLIELGSVLRTMVVDSRARARTAALRKHRKSERNSTLSWLHFRIDPFISDLCGRLLHKEWSDCESKDDLVQNRPHFDRARDDPRRNSCLRTTGRSDAWSRPFDGPLAPHCGGGSDYVGGLVLRSARSCGLRAFRFLRQLISRSSFKRSGGAQRHCRKWRPSTKC